MTPRFFSVSILLILYLKSPSHGFQMVRLEPNRNPRALGLGVITFRTPQSSVRGFERRKVHRKEWQRTVINSQVSNSDNNEELVFAKEEGVILPEAGGDDENEGMDSSVVSPYTTEESAISYGAHQGVDESTRPNIDVKSIVISNVIAFAAMGGAAWLAAAAFHKRQVGLVDQFVVQANGFIGDIAKLGACVRMYKFKLGPRQMRDQMFLQLMGDIVIRKQITIETVRAIKHVAHVLKLNQVRVAKTIDKLGRTLNVGDSQKLLFYTERLVYNDKKAEKIIQPLRLFLEEQFRDTTTDDPENTRGKAIVNHSQVDMAIEALKISFPNGYPALDSDITLPPGFQILGLSEEQCRKHMKEWSHENPDDDEWKNTWVRKYKSPDEIKAEKRKRREEEKARLEEKRKAHLAEQEMDGGLLQKEEDRVRLVGDNSDLASGGENIDLLDMIDGGSTGNNGERNISQPSHAYECSKCSYTMFVAPGRESKFFGDDFICPECGSDKSKFRTRVTSPPPRDDV